jgi:actin beta/gamma 1
MGKKPSPTHAWQEPEEHNDGTVLSRRESTNYLIQDGGFLDLRVDGQPVVIDNGTSSIKVGIATEQAPSAVFASMVGKAKKQKVIIGTEVKNDTYIGDAAQQHRGILAIRHPITNGVVTNWDDIQLLWQHAFDNELRIPSDSATVLLADDPFNTLSNREEMVQLLFETFRVGGVYVCNTGALSIYAAGATSGVVLSSGHGSTAAVPVYEGHSLNHGLVKAGATGEELTEYMGQLLRESSLPTNIQGLDVSAVKAAVCYVAKDYDKEFLRQRAAVAMEYKLPDGHVVEVDEARYRCPEPLFKPELRGLKTPGIHEAIVQAVNRCDSELTATLESKIVLSGGNTMYPGMESRLQSELKAVLGYQVNDVVAAPERQYYPWIGGAMLASTTTMKDLWISLDDYTEVGPKIIARKCF